LKASAAILLTFFALCTSSTLEPVSVEIARQTSWFVLAFESFRASLALEDAGEKQNLKCYSSLPFSV
jgi:hypothetical protein